jgi:hypothetical protein
VSRVYRFEVPGEGSGIEVREIDDLCFSIAPAAIEGAQEEARFFVMMSR